jgi:uracil-DNA glycosylase
MLLQPVWEWLEAQIFSLPAVSAGPRPCFNPYRGVNPAVDRPGADHIRRANLQQYLASFKTWPETLVIGEAPGWRGCRFSGVPFTSEAQLCSGLPFQGASSSLVGKPHVEAAATLFWQVMQGYHPSFLVWNSLPLHPHQPGEPLTNRAPSHLEIRQVAGLLAELISLIRPRLVIAVGKSAATAAQPLGVAAIQVRHPSHGGAKAFATGIQSIFEAENHLQGSTTQTSQTIGYNSGTFLAPKVDQKPPL